MTTLGAGGEADRARLRSISAGADEPTLEVLEGLCEAGARIADVGCGNGSIACTLAERDPLALVWAVDQDTSLLPTVVPGNVRPIRTDLRTWDPREPLDLVHARFVLAHLADPEAAIRRLLGLLRPGGRIVVTEPCHLPVEADGVPGDEGAVTRVLAAYRSLAEQDGLSFGFALRAPGLLAGLGAVEVRVSTRASRLGGGPGVDRWESLVTRVEERLDVTGADLEAFHRFAGDAHTFAVPQVIVTVVARREPSATRRESADPVVPHAVAEVDRTQ